MITGLQAYKITGDALTSLFRKFGEVIVHARKLHSLVKGPHLPVKLGLCPDPFYVTSYNITFRIF
jgi:hypothetical protein